MFFEFSRDWTSVAFENDLKSGKLVDGRSKFLPEGWL